MSPRLSVFVKIGGIFFTVKTSVGVLVLLLLLGILGFVLYNSIESYEEKISTSWSKPALRNPYFAAEKLLTQLGKRVESSHHLKTLDKLPDEGVLFISDPHQLQTQVRVDKLLDWMKSGGNLVVGAQINIGENKNLLLDYFGVTKVLAGVPEEEKSDNSKKDPNNKSITEILREVNKEVQKRKSTNTKTNTEDKKEVIPDAEVAKLHFSAIPQEIRVHFRQEYVLYHPILDDEDNENYEGPKPFYWEGVTVGPQIMQYFVGKGLFTVLVDESIWRSDSIGEFDHAYLLSLLMPGDEVVLLHGMQVPSLFSMIRSNLPEVLLASILWLLIWLLYKTMRFGPPLENAPVSRRSIKEHIVACTEYLWKTKNYEAIISDIHAGVLRKIKRANLVFDSLTTDEKIKWISHRCGISETEVARAMYPTDLNKVERFQHTIRLIQIIGNKL